MVFIELRRDDPRAVYRQIADEVVRAVSVGLLKPGDPLPATRRLATELKLNTNTVQHAYRTLLQEGVVEMRRGLGAFVAARPRETRRSSQAIARQIAERALREGFREGVLASELISALAEIAPVNSQRHNAQLPTTAQRATPKTPK
jgi:GntR family transcriptional regulator